MNLTHCQGKLLNMFKDVSVGQYFFNIVHTVNLLQNISHKNIAYIQHNGLDMIKKKTCRPCVSMLSWTPGDLYKGIPCCTSGPYGNQVKTTISLGPGLEFSSQ